MRKLDPKLQRAPSRTPFCLMDMKGGGKEEKLLLLVTSAGQSETPCYLRRKASWPGPTPLDSVLTTSPNFSTYGLSMV